MTPVHAANQREFFLDQTVNIPRRLSEYARGNKTLFVATLKATFITVDSIGAEFIHLFEDGVTLRRALAAVQARHGNNEQVIRSLGDLLVQIETKKFYQHAEIKEDLFDSLTMLARLTNRCNLRCIHCHVSSAPDWPTEKDLDTAAWCVVLEEYSAFARNNGFSNLRVTFTGGEALTRVDAFDILQHSKALGLRTELYTNGVLIVNARMASRVASVVDEVQVSFDGASAPVHDKIRGAGMFERTVRGTKLLAEAEVPFRFSIVVMPQNFQDLMDNLPSLIRSIGGSFNVKLGLATIEGRADRSMQFASPLEAEEKLKALIEYLAREGVRNERPITNNLKQVSCGYGRELTVDSDGLVYGCGPQSFPIGNLKMESFTVVAQRTIAKSKGAEIDSVEGCRECDIRYVCGGICRIMNMSKMGSATISSCDRANKERNILKLFGRSGDFVPLSLLEKSGVQLANGHSAATTGLVSLST